MLQKLFEKLGIKKKNPLDEPLTHNSTDLTTNQYTDTDNSNQTETDNNADSSDGGDTSGDID